MKICRVLLVEDDMGWQQAITVLLGTSLEVSYQVVGVTDNIDEALMLAQAEKPDLCLLDFNINGPANGLMVGQALIKEGFTPEQLVMVTTMSQAELGEHPFGYVSKAQVATHLLKTLSDRLLLLETV